MYKGYLRGDGKHASTKVINSRLLSWETLKSATTEPNVVGVLSDDYIMVDLDDMSEAKKLYKIVTDSRIQCSILQTNHGMHFYFKGYTLSTNKIGWYTPIGLKADFKLGIKNTADPIRIDGKSRHWLHKSKTFDSLPKWLIPVSNHENGIDDISNGERNQGLFNYILTLQRTGLSREEIRETIRIVNKFILDDPLPDKEVETILRDEAFLKQTFFSKSGGFLHDKFAKFLINEHHIKKIDGILHVYKDGVYSGDPNDIEHVMIKHISSLTMAKRREVLSYLNIVAPQAEESDSKYILVANGVFDIETCKLIPFTPNIVITNKVHAAYIPDAYNEVTDKVLDKLTCGDGQLRAVIEEFVGYTLFRKNSFSKAAILTGDGGHGKSSFLDMLKLLLGEENFASVELKDLDARFKPAELVGKLANIGDDISNEYIKTNSAFKKLVTGESLNIERKGKDPFDFKNHAKLIFSANETPHINDHSNGLTRRLLFIPFRAVFSEDDPDYDPFIDEKLQTQASLDYLLLLGLKGLQRLLNNHRFTKSKVSDAQLQDYSQENNPLLLYLNEEPKFINENTKDCYLAYTVWCADNNVRSLSNIVFSREVCRLKGLRTKQQKIDNKKRQVFVKTESQSNKS
ncbi:phage/plasmid primase, P4 family [Lacticaseibacillus jixiensis]|uniref:phage/plasmid primase, P4 family n=1 Tax=Lacticaseibacillus jixiensis TaxID=3231926 RepID=UPI0036F1BB15